MEARTQAHLENIYSKDKQAQNEAYYALMAATEQPVDWAYAAWDDLVAGLSHKDNHVRAIAAQLLCNLAQSDPDKRMQRDFPALLNVTRDERFVTARHCMQNIWKVGLAGADQRQMLLDGLAGRFDDCRSEKNWSLIRYDIVQTLRNLYNAVGDEAVKTLALALIEQEDDLKYRKKYAGVWKSA
jgi:hypothetical protein